MKTSHFVAVALLALLLPLSMFAQSATPQMKSVEPDTAKGGASLKITGENLEKAFVDKVFLTDSAKYDLALEIVSQDKNEIVVKVPEKVRTGRLALMLLTKGSKGNEPKYIEQPVKVTIE